MSREQLLEAASDFAASFGIEDSVVAVANVLFPAKANFAQEQDSADVARNLQRATARAPGTARTLKNDIDIIRGDPHNFLRPDATANCLLKMKKAHLLRREEVCDSSGSSPGSCGNSSPFLRTSAGRDVLATRVKKEVLTPISSSSSGIHTPLGNYKFRSHTMSTPSYSSSSESKFHNSVEKGSVGSVQNPLFSPFGNGSTVKVSDTPIRPPYPNSLPPPYPGSLTAPSIARRYMPPKVPTDVFCNELRNALQGLPGMYFVDDGTGNLKLSSTCSLAASDEPVVRHVLRTANMFIRIHRKSCLENEGSAMRQVLLDGVSTLLRDYLSDVSNIPLKGHLGIRKAQVLAMARGWHFHLADMEVALSLENSSPMEILDTLYILWRAKSGESNVFAKLLEFCMAVFCNTLRIWLTSGVLHDSEEWMIQASGDSFHLLRVPLFFCSHISNLILKIGTSLQYVTGDDIAVVDAYKMRILSELNADRIYDLSNRSSLIMFLTNMWLVVAKNVSNRLVLEGKLIDHLKAARMFMLVEDSFFTRELYSSLMHATMGLKTTISQSTASSLFMSSLRKSPSSTAFPFRVHIEVMTSENDSPNTSSRMQFVRPLRPVYIAPDICKPVFVGTDEMYESIFQAIWQIEVAMLSIEEVNDRLRINHRKINRNTNLLSFHRQLSFTLSAIGIVIERLRQYVRTVIDINFSKMLVRLSDLSEIDAAAEQHRTFLADVNKHLFLNKSDENVNNHVSTILQLADDAVSCGISFLNSSDERDTFRAQSKYSFASETKQFESLEQELDLCEDLVGSKRVSLKVIQATFQKCYADLGTLASTTEYLTPCISVLRVK